MKSILIVAATLAGLVASAFGQATHGVTESGGRVDVRRNGFSESSWGEYQVGGDAAYIASAGWVGPGLLLDLGAYTDGVTANLGGSQIAGSTFQTFCIERNESVAPVPLDIYVSMQDDSLAASGSHAWAGGLGDNDAEPGDDLDQRTAYLYSQFVKGVLTGYDWGAGGYNGLLRAQTAAALQMTIWYIENEIDLPFAKSFLDDDQGALVDVWLAESAANANGIGAVRVLQSAHLDGSNAQDLLYMSTPPVCSLTVTAEADENEVPTTGADVTFTYTITNGATLPMSNVTVVDAFGPVPGAPTSLAAGEAVVLTRTQFVIPPISNTVTAIGDLALDVRCTEMATVDITEQAPECELSVQAHSCPTRLYECGGWVFFTYVITNNGTTALTDLTVTDAWGQIPWAPTTIGPGETIQVYRAKWITPPINNVVTVTGNASSDQQCTATTEIPIDVIAVCDLKLCVTANPDEVPAAGGDVTFTYKITNDAALPMTEVEITDSFGPVAGAPSTIAAGETVVLTVTQFVNPPFTNTLNVAGNLSPTTTCSKSRSVTVQPKCALDLTVSACPQEVPACGGNVTFKYVLKNNGGTKLYNLKIIDKWGTVSTLSSLSPGSTVTKYRTVWVKPPVTNAVNVTTCGSDCSATGSITVTPRPECDLHVAVDADPQQVPDAGGNVTFTYTITNDAALPMTDVVIADSFGAVPGAPTTIDAGQTIVLTATEFIIPPYVNTLDVEGDLSPTVTCSKSKSVTIEKQCSLELIVTACPEDVPACGANVTFKYVVKNNGSTKLYNVKIVDKWGTVVSGATIWPGSTLTKTRCKWVKPPVTNDVTVVAGACTAEGSITLEAPPEGCSASYWKCHTCNWQGYSKYQDFDQVFGVNAFNPNISLVTALGQTSSSGKNALAREAVAALLNAAHGSVEYPMTPNEVIDLVQDALAPGGDINGAKSLLADANSAYCPI